MEQELKRNLDRPVMRDWLRAEGELPIASITADKEIETFASTVGEQDNENLKQAIRAIVAQAKDEIKKKSGSALLVCKKYYLKWRGHARNESGKSKKSKRKGAAEKGSYGLFLVRGCQRCRLIEDTDGNKLRATAAVFRIPAYHATPRAASVRKSTQPKEKGTGEAPSVTERPKTCRCDTHDTAKPWKCKCCKHLYCPGHEGEGHINLKRAECDTCKKDKWKRRSKSAKGNVILKLRKALNSCYESLRAGVFFVNAGLTKDMAEYLLGKYETTSGSVASQDSAELGQGSTARAESIAEQSDSAAPVATPQAAVASTSPAAVASAPGPVGPEAERVPKITLGTPLRASRRSRSKTGRLSSFGKRMV